MTKNYFEDYSVGEIQVSPSRAMTESDVVAYSMFSGNWQRPVAGVIPGGRVGQVVPQMLVYSIGLCLLTRIGAYVNMPRKLIAFIGFDAIVFVSDVFVGDVISSRATVVGTAIRDESRGVVSYRQETVNQHGDVVQYSVHHILIWRRASEA
jgi:3-hydroxybutyryl-CoA dehydratase